jgi:hypothetical protein
MTVGTLAPNEKDLYKIVNIVRQLAEGRSNLISAYIAPLLSAADRAAALTALGVSGYIQTLLNAADAAAARVALGLADTGFSTGDAKITLKITADPGWLIMNDGTIGSDTSGATYQNANAQALFTLLFNNVDDTAAPLFTSAGSGTTRAAQGNAATAWVNNCRMSLTKQLGRGLAVAGSGSGLTTRTLGRADGAETHTQTLSEMVAHNHGFAGFNAITTDTSISTFSPGGTAFYNTTSNVGATNTVGGGGPMNVMNPRSYWNVMIKL